MMKDDDKPQTSNAADAGASHAPTTRNTRQHTDTMDAQPDVARHREDTFADSVTPGSTTLFDHRICGRQSLTFDYAQPVFATSDIDWTDAQLEELHLTDIEGRYTNTALLISDQCPYRIKYTVFEGDSKATVTERHRLTGSLLSQVNEAMQLINEHNDDDAWPPTALRESLLNAVLHRSYELSGPTLISTFASRIEIVSLGGLIGGLEVNDLLNGVSQTRNVWLAELFAELGLSENIGTGVQRILESYADSAVSPQLRVGPSSLAMVLPRPVKEDDMWPQPELPTDGANDIDGLDLDPDRGQGAQDDKAQRYEFPAAHPYTTDDPAAALSGSRVIGVAPLKTLVLASAPATERERPTLKGQGDGLPQYPIKTLVEEVTLHLFANRGVQLTRTEVEQSLGLNERQASRLLHSLTEQGKLESSGQAEGTSYRLSQA